MKLKYQAQKGSRIKYNFITMDISNEVNPEQCYTYSFNHTKGKDFDKYLPNSYYETNDWEWRGTCPWNIPKSPKALVRWINKHKEIPKGSIVTLCSRWVGHNITVKIK